VYRSLDGSDIQQQIGTLPAGWEKQLTEKGKVYYIDHNTKETHWELPEHLHNDLLPHCNLISRIDEEEEEENQV